MNIFTISMKNYFENLTKINDFDEFNFQLMQTGLDHQNFINIKKSKFLSNFTIMHAIIFQKR